jgi:hypothetical protein
MNGDTLMRCLIVFYVVLAGVYCWELNWPKVMYWVAAAALTTSVLWGMPK